MDTLKKIAFVFVFAWAIQHLCCFNTAAQESTKNSTEFESLISALADDDPALRRNAESELLAAGLEAIPSISVGTRSSNLEINRRCKILLEKIELQRKKKVAESFLATSLAEKDRIKLAAWPAFSEFTASDNLLTRKLFLKMCEQIPAAFESYGIKGDLSASSLKQLARTILIPNKHPGASSESIVLSYLFLVDQAKRAAAISSEATELFSKVEVLEAVSFFTNGEHAGVGRKSESREMIDRIVAAWVKENCSFKTNTDADLLKLIYRTSNLELIRELDAEYAAMDPANKLKYLDIVSAAFRPQDPDAIAACYPLLQRALADESILVSSRVRKRPSEKVEVTAKMLAEASLAKLLKNTEGGGPAIKMEAVFGSYPLSFSQFLLIENEKDQESLLNRVQARIAKTDAVK